MSSVKKQFVISLFLCLTALCSAQTCTEVADRLISKLGKTSLQTDFNISITEPETQSLNYSGHILTQGRKFYLQMMTTQAYYDGTSLSVYDSDIDEVNISTPTDDELLESNPLMLVQVLRNNCRLYFTDSFKDPNQWSVDFYPNDKKSSVLKYTIQFRRSDLVPTKIIVSETLNRTTTIIFSGQRYGIDTNGKFTFNKALHPNVSINDLR